MAVRAVLFDIDGTLVDSNAFHVEAWQQAFALSGLLIPRDRIASQIGKGSDMLIPSLAPGLDQRAAKEAADAHDRIFKSRYLPQVVPFQHATDLLRRLHGEGKKLVLASSAKQEDLDHYVKILNAAPLVAATTCADDVERSKPARDIFASALAKIAPIEAGESVAIGDTPYDVISAGKCSVRTIAVRSGGFDDATLTAAGAVAIYNDVGALLASLEASPLA